MKEREKKNVKRTGESTRGKKRDAKGRREEEGEENR